MNEFDPIKCPVGIKNCSEIDRVKDKLDMAIERLEEKIGDMKEDLTSRMDTGFANVEEKLDNLDTRMTNMETGMDARIDAKVEAKIDEKRGKAAAGAWKYLLVGICIPVIINLISAIIRAKIG